MLNNYILLQIASRFVCVCVCVCLWSVCVCVCVCGRCVCVCFCGRYVYVCERVVGNASMLDLLLYVITVDKIHESRTLASRRSG